ncbi:DUF6396 domain-containing protein [uncultured Pluralibacter sp.]|uniref:SEL1-like repeat protein n=1 Tax=uncultured Pluralibacter sp. TaxID=1490864 RepID=UPI00262CEB80|nr:DUF6396 domain-containing protein [uncultured Pluralibacter sp.]
MKGIVLILTVMMLSGIMLAGCDESGPAGVNNRNSAVAPLPEINPRLSFTCKHQIIPAPSADSDVLFKYARWLQKNNQLAEDAAVTEQVARLYRIAAENGHYKANINLQNGALRGHFSLSGPERLRFSQALIDAGVGAGYYFVAIYLQHGAAGLQQDEAMALRYYRKAADEGNPQAQAYIGEKLAPVELAPDVSRQLRRCAAEQGDGEAATALGVDLKNRRRYQEAIEAFQLGVSGGSDISASFLASGFSDPEPGNTLDYLALGKDLERAKRYAVIGKILSGYSYAHPTVPEINDIVPLPPAPLPTWDGSLKWLDERNANVAPEKPSESLINRLAKAKQLNPATGKPLPGSPHFDKYAGVPVLCRSGEPCPQSGYWQVARLPAKGIIDDAIRYFVQGAVLPAERVEYFSPRPWPLKDKREWREEDVEWRLVGEA